MNEVIHDFDGLFLTGGTGFFGLAILREIETLRREENFRISILSRDPNAFISRYPSLARGIAWIRADLEKTPLENLRGNFSHILHAAADSTSFLQLGRLQRYDQIVEGTRRMLEFAVKCGARRFLLTSSGGVYGRQPPSIKAIPEDYLGMPDPLYSGNVYSVAKRAAEHLCALYAEEYGLEIVIARCFAFVGKDLPLNAHFAIGNFIRDAIWSDEIIVEGNGSPIRSYLDQRDLAHWLMVLLRAGVAGEAYNVGSNRAISIAELAHLVRDLVSPGKRVRILGKPVNDAECNRYVPDISKIDLHLGLRPTYTLENSILATAAAARARGKRY